MFRHRLLPVVAVLLVAASPARPQQGTPIYVEDSPDAAEMIKQAEHLRNQSRLTDAAAAYQNAAQQYAHRLLLWKDDVFIDVPRWVRRAVAADAELLAAYRQLHEPQAQRALREASEPAPVLGALGAVAARYGLCESGFEAAMRVAAMLLERARPGDAAGVLDELADHPDLPAHRARWHRLAAAAGVYSRDDDRYVKHLNALRALKDEAGQRMVETLRARLVAQPSGGALHAFATLPAATFPQPLGRPLYELDAADGRATQRHDNAGRPLTHTAPNHIVFPVADGDVLYVNTGATLRALDRSSLSDVWSQPYQLGAIDGGTIPYRVGRQPDMFDARNVLIDGQRLVAVMGQDGISRTSSLNASRPDTVIVALDRRNGHLLWRRTPAELDPQLENAFLHGGAVGGDGRAFFLLRRAQNSGFRDGYLIAVDTAQGVLLWKRHISSTTIHYANRALTRPLYRHGRLYVADNLGAVACVDARSGDVRWLSRMSQLRENVVGASLIAGEAWQLSQPLLVPAGLIVPPFVPGTPAILLNPDTGQRINELADDRAWTHAHYLAEAGDNVLSVSGDVRLFDGTTLKLKWTHELGSNLEPRARAAVTADRVLIPLDRKLLVLDLESGRKVDDSAMEHTGNVLALEGQVLIASGDKLLSYMTWPVVYENLTQRMRREPTDAHPGLALARAALASRRFDEAMEGVRHVVAVLRHRALTRPAELRPETDAAHAEIFGQLLRLTEPDIATDPQVRRRLFDEVAKATATPADEVQYHLAFASYLVETEWPAEQRQDRLRDAVRHYQTVLENPTLAGQLYQRRSAWQQAELEARQRLAALVERFSKAIYAEYDDRAAASLDELLQSQRGTAETFMELARRYPLADAAPRALYEAGKALVKDERPVDAITQWRRAFREQPDAALKQRILGALIEQYIAVGKPRRARQWLERAQRDQVKPIRGGREVTAAAWLAELGDDRAAAGLAPVIRPTLGEPVTLPGRLLVPQRQPREQWPSDRIVTITADGVQLRAGPQLDVRWQAAIDPDAKLLWLSEPIVLFQQGAKLLALNGRTGKPLWDEIDVVELFKDVAVLPQRPPLALDEGGLDQRRPDEPRIEMRGGRLIIRGDVPVPMLVEDALPAAPNPNPRFGPLLRHGQPVAAFALFEEQAIEAVVNDAVICLVDAQGRAIAIDTDSGQVVWRYVCPFDRLERVAVSGESVAFAGVSRQGMDTESALIVSLDALTGETLCQLDAPGRVAWVGLNDIGVLLHIAQPRDPRNPAMVSMHQLPDGELLWRADLVPGRIEAVIQAGDGAMALIEYAGPVLIDAINRKVYGPIRAFTQEVEDRIDMMVAGEHWHLMTPQQQTAVRGDGQLLWRDGLDRDAGERLLQLASRDYIILVTAPLPIDPVERMRRRMLELERFPDRGDGAGVTYGVILLDREGGAIVAEPVFTVPGGRIEPAWAHVLDHRIVLSTGARTIIIPDKASDD